MTRADALRTAIEKLISALTVEVEDPATRRRFKEITEELDENFEEIAEREWERRMGDDL